jgi:L-fuconolactonase
MVTEADWEHWKPTDFARYLDVVFDAFGANRVMFGSDWPVCLVAASYAQVVGALEEYARKLSPADRGKVFFANAARFYGLEMPTHGFAAQG